MLKCILAHGMNKLWKSRFCVLPISGLCERLPCLLYLAKRKAKGLYLSSGSLGCFTGAVIRMLNHRTNASAPAQPQHSPELQQSQFSGSSQHLGLHFAQGFNTLFRSHITNKSEKNNKHACVSPGQEHSALGRAHISLSGFSASY